MSWRDREATHTEIEVLVLRATDRAVQVDHEGEEEWIPRSCIRDGEDLEEGFEGEIEVADWKLRALGWDG